MSKPITAQKVVLTSFFVDLLDIVINLVMVLITGSVVMTAELVQGISDLTASGLLLIGLKRPKRESRSWALSSAVVMLFIASFISFYSGLKRFLNPQEITNIYAAYLALIIGAISNGYAFLLSAKRIKEHKNNHLILTKNTFVLDLMGMSAAIVGFFALILYQIFGDIRFDAIGAMGIGVVLAILSLRLIWNIKRHSRKLFDL